MRALQLRSAWSQFGTAITLHRTCSILRPLDYGTEPGFFRGGSAGIAQEAALNGLVSLRDRRAAMLDRRQSAL